MKRTQTFWDSSSPLGRTLPIWAALVVITAAACAALATWFGANRQRASLTQVIDAVLDKPRVAVTVESRPEALRRLPNPVARYLQWALPAGTELEVVRIRQTGMLRTDTNRERWLPFEAEHLVAPQTTRFVWNARVSVAPLLHVQVRDALVSGHGSGTVSLQSAFTVANVVATPEMNSGSLHRFLAEAVWYPTALLPSSKLQWQEIDTCRALATLTDGDETVSLEFRFGESGEVTGIYTPKRWGRFSGAFRQVPWEGHFYDYERRAGMRVPSAGEVGWYIDGEWRVVWRGRIVGYETRPYPPALTT